MTYIPTNERTSQTQYASHHFQSWGHNKGTNMQQQPDSGQYIKHIHPLSMCAPSMNFVGLTVRELFLIKVWWTFLMFENWRERNMNKGMNKSSSLIPVYRIYQPFVQVCTNFVDLTVPEKSVTQMFIWKHNIITESQSHRMNESQNGGRTRQSKYSPLFQSSGAIITYTYCKYKNLREIINWSETAGIYNTTCYVLIPNVLINSWSSLFKSFHGHLRPTLHMTHA